ncbi:hypothetical protein EF68_002636 [Salmonella enterica subsp. enterica]|nr:hypothetical protein [Salmonella enterica]EAA7352484.1 hypothetical protein [Salmonella enterica subsp. enterica]EAB7347148.1 hypothetical protein [Salmonella enterica subsp. enterica serovar Epalinges]EAO1509011.1 hypothetical protein [Salmonella enterica subsp. enterica serovar Bere]EBR9809918.1 hypothetical protein [Salmonella enterica subsp. enterica serovar Teshie]EBS0652365.1 hypothetical protein [Salmonella enterica subsp. enterica serovar Yolo]EBV8480707.1 hypothetical protein [Sal
MSTNEMTQAELAKSNAKIVKLNAKIAKLIAETSKLNRESAWYPIVVATGLVGAVATITTVLLKLI